ncbi:MAG: ATP-binding cassette domain-containing protein [Candidatus Aminicenantaceae bacterium]
MLQLHDLKYSIAGREILSGVDWFIQSGQRDALLGPNGAGKTTLLKIINGDITSYKGSITKPKRYKIAYLPQEETALEGTSVLDTVIEGRKEVAVLEKKIAKIHDALNDSSNKNELLEHLGKLEHKFQALEGYKMETDAKTILSGLGFSSHNFAHPLSDFSGGWRMRVYLARLLVQKPDILLLDEPSNHLDLPSLEWLEKYLLQFKGSIVVVSHDRFFIDRIADEIYELENGRLEFYPGDYHKYEQEKDKKRERLLKKWKEQSEERKRQERFISRYRYKKDKAAQVQSRIKYLNEMEIIELPKSSSSVQFNLSVSVPSYKDVLEIKNMSFRYEKEWIFSNINLNLYRGEKIALVGANGSGKTTLTKLITSKLKPDLGTISLGKRTHIGYYAQHLIEMLNLESTIYDEVLSSADKNYIPRIRDVLGIFQFSGDDVFKKIKVLSGGEKARVSLAKILLFPVNFIIMDEPTTHLDVVSKEALEYALSGYNGTLLLISHDRYFLDKLVHRVIEIKDKKLNEYPGNYSYYLEKREKQAEDRIQLKTKKQVIVSGKKTKQQKRMEAEARKSITKERNQLNQNIKSKEQRIDDIEEEIKDIEKEMANPETYKESGKIVSLQKRHAALKKELENLYQDWEKSKLKLEKLMETIKS